MLIHFWSTVHLHPSSKIKSHKEVIKQEKTGFSSFFCLLIEGSGFVHINYGSGCRSRRPKTYGSGFWKQFTNGSWREVGKKLQFLFERPITNFVYWWAVSWPTSWGSRRGGCQSSWCWGRRRGCAPSKILVYCWAVNLPPEVPGKEVANLPDVGAGGEDTLHAGGGQVQDPRQRVQARHHNHHLAQGRENFALYFSLSFRGMYENFA